uniref:Uncharacterized protein n=1 Tax=Rhizophora mucronata TaxID=61149 RepID=A0A2P2PCJ9_RHIMU
MLFAHVLHELYCSSLDYYWLADNITGLLVSITCILFFML